MGNSSLRLAGRLPAGRGCPAGVGHFLRALRRLAAGFHIGWQTMSDKARRKQTSAFVLAVASGRTVRDAAAQAGISEATAYRWMKGEDIRRDIMRLRAELIDQAAGRLAAVATEAAESLRALLAAESEAVRLGAARTLLELAFRSRELVDWEARLTELERKLGDETSSAD